MSQAQRTRMTPEEFLAWEARQEFKWEFDGFAPVAMTGATDAHAAVQGNIVTALNNRLRGKPCYVRGLDIKVQTGPGYRYPDAFVSCTPVPPGAIVATEPVVIFEVLSDSTARTDRTIKASEYCALPSVQRYVLLEQDQAWATVIARTPSGWGIEFLSAVDTLRMPEIGVEVPVSELYEGVAFPPGPDL